MKPVHRMLTAMTLACLAGAAPLIASSAELELQGSRLVVTGMLDGTATQSFAEYLSSGMVRTVVFEDSFGGTAEAAEAYAHAIRTSGVNTEALGQCYAACAYAFLAGKEHRFARGLNINQLLIPIASRPKAGELANRWRGDEAQKTLAEFTTMASASASTPPSAGGDGIKAPAGVELVSTVVAPRIAGNWQPDQGVMFNSTPTLFGRVYKTYYCDGTQGRDFSKCDALDDADPYKLGVLTP